MPDLFPLAPWQTPGADRNQNLKNLEMKEIRMDRVPEATIRAIGPRPLVDFASSHARGSGQPSTTTRAPIPPPIDWGTSVDAAGACAGVRDAAQARQAQLQATRGNRDHPSTPGCAAPNGRACSVPWDEKDGRGADGIDKSRIRSFNPYGWADFEQVKLPSEGIHLCRVG